jgi:hypothetical protein
MGKRKRWTPEERREWRRARDARLKELREHIDRIKAELEARKKPA